MNTPTPTPRTDAAANESIVKVHKTSLQLEIELTAALEELNSINAEREAHRGTRKAWIELDDNRQILEKQLKAVTEQRDRLAVVVNRWRKGKHSGEYGVALRRCISEIDEAFQSLNQPEP